MLITSLHPEIAEDCRIFVVVVKITTAFILGLGKSIWFIQMLQLLNIIAFICTYLGGGVDGEKLWGWGMGSQRQQWVISREQQTTGHVHRQASPNPPGEADMGGRGARGTGNNRTLSCLPCWWCSSQTLQKKEGDSGNQVSTVPFSTFITYSTVGEKLVTMPRRVLQIFD